MNRKKIAMLATALMVCLCLASCKKETPTIVGKLWQWNTTASIFGVADQPASVRLIASTENTGMLFVVIEDETSPWDAAIACPFTYTCEDDEGTLSVDISYLTDYDEDGNYSTVSMPWSYDKDNNRLNLTINGVNTFLHTETANITLDEQPFTTVKSMKGTSWTADMSEEEGEEYIIELNFTGEKEGQLVENYSFDGENDKETFKLNYSYTGGLGEMTYTMWEIVSHGGFYLIDPNTLFVCDGVNLLTMKKK